jgi:hypothetical protein
MAVAQHVLTLTGSAQALSTASGASSNAIRTVSIQPGTANANPVFIGDVNVSDTVYGIRIPASVTNEPPAPIILGETQSQVGHFKLSDVYVRGTNTEKVHLLVVTI